MESKKMSYVKILAIHSGELIATEITEEVHRANTSEAADYIKTHPHDENTMWIILPTETTLYHINK